MFRALSSVLAILVNANRASKVGSRSRCSAVGSSARSFISARTAEVTGKDEEKTCEGFTDIKIRARVCAAVLAAVSSEGSWMTGTLEDEADAPVVVSYIWRRSFTAPC